MKHRSCLFLAATLIFAASSVQAQSVLGITRGFSAGRVYAPSATLYGTHDLTVIFAGYHTPKPKNSVGDYRTIGRISLHSSVPIADASTNVRAEGGTEEPETD